MQPSLPQSLPATAPLYAPARQDISDQKNPFLNQATPPPPLLPNKKILAKMSNHKSRNPAPPSLPSTPPRGTNLPILQTVFSFLLSRLTRTPRSDESLEQGQWQPRPQGFSLKKWVGEALETRLGQWALASRALFFASLRVNLHEKSLKKTKWFAQPSWSSPARYWRKERTNFETLLLAYFFFKLMTWSAQSRTY